MDRYYNLTDEQARYIQGKDWFVIVVPLEKQLQSNHPQLHVYAEYDTFVRLGENLPDTEVYDVNLLYPLNSRVGLRETWNDSGLAYHYKAKCWCKFDHSETPWHSPVIMPYSAIRHWGKITGHRVCRVQSIDDFSKLVFPMSMIGSLQNSFERWYNTTYERRNGFIPFESDPWVEVATWEREK